MKSILTRYAGNHKDGMGKIQASDGARSITVPYAHELGFEGRRRAAAMDFLKEFQLEPRTRGEWVAGDLDGQWDLVFTFVPARYAVSVEIPVTLPGGDQAMVIVASEHLAPRDYRATEDGTPVERDATGEWVNPMWESDKRNRHYLTDDEVFKVRESTFRARHRVTVTALAKALAEEEDEA